MKENVYVYILSIVRIFVNRLVMGRVPFNQNFRKYRFKIE